MRGKLDGKLQTSENNLVMERLEAVTNQKQTDVPPSGLVIFESRYAPGCSGEHKDIYSKFYFLVSGHAQWGAGAARYSLGPDTLCHIPAGQRHYEGTRANEPVLAYVIRYRSELLLPAISTQLTALGMIPLDLSTTNVNQARAVKSIFQDMLFEQEACQEGWEWVLQSRLTELAIRVVRLVRRRGRSDLPLFEAGNDSADRVARYALRLKSQFFRQETMAEAARSVGMSRRHFTLLFRKVTGQTWRQYLLGLRFGHVAKLLIETDRSVIEVASESGFDDLSHFHHSFKSTYGCSPLAYREQWRVRLPAKLSPFPQPQPDGKSQSGFKLRGTKGWLWTVEQYLEEIPVLASLKMNFLMNCPVDVVMSRPGELLCNEWWKPMTNARKEAYASIIRACRKHGIKYCFSLRPQLASAHPLDPGSSKDIEALYHHYAWALGEGVQWFSICLDGASWDVGGPRCAGAVHAALVNKFLAWLRAKQPDAQLVLCPIPCWGDGTNFEHRGYLETLARDMDPDVYVFWNGDSIVTPRVTRVAAESYKTIVKHRLFLWDNYPVNDNNPTMHLGPVRGRDSDLSDVIDGYLTNPMCSQNQINRIPLATCADYAYNPGAYDAARSIGQAVLRLARTTAQQQVLKDLVDAYPGFIVAGGATGTNPVRGKLGSILAKPYFRSAAENFIQHIEATVSRLTKQFPAQFFATKKTILEDIKWMRQQLARME